MDISRRWFIGGAASFGALAGCRLFKGVDPSAGSAPRLTFGVVSDIHIRDLAAPGENALSAKMNELTFVHTLEWFRDQGVDAVVIAGDMADKGLVRQLENVAAAWYRVFPNDRAPDGRKVEKLFVYGNHDMGGIPYARQQAGLEKMPEAQLASMTVFADPKAAWEKAFHEPFEPVWAKSVRGYRFVGAQWVSQQGCNGSCERFNLGLGDWYRAHAKAFDPSLPSFHVQHCHPKDTCYGPWAWGRDDGLSTQALSAFPNAIAFSGHSHYSLTDERSVWQGAFTSVGTSSLRYTGTGHSEFPNRAFENAGSSGKNAWKCNAVKMTPLYPERDTCRQGMLWKVYGDHIAVRRREFFFDNDLGPDWVIPLPAAESKPFAFAARAKKVAAPEFPANAELALSRAVGQTRGAKKGRHVPHAVAPVKKDALKIVIPAVVVREDARAYRYEIAITSAGGRAKFGCQVLAEGFNQSVKLPRTHAPTVCVLALDELPKGALEVAVTPVNCYGCCGKPLKARFTA